MVGVNKYQMEEPKRTIDTLYIDRTIEKQQAERLAALRKRRDPIAYQAAMKKVYDSAKAGQNMCGPILEAVKAYATLQEICDAMRSVYGIYRDVGSF